MTDIHAVIAELKALEAKATKGEWKREFDDLTEEEIIYPTGISCYGKGSANCYCDIDLCVLSRNALPHLLAYIARLEEEMEEAGHELRNALERDE